MHVDKKIGKGKNNYVKIHIFTVPMPKAKLEKSYMLDFHLDLQSKSQHYLFCCQIVGARV